MGNFKITQRQFDYITKNITTEPIEVNGEFIAIDKLSSTQAGQFIRNNGKVANVKPVNTQDSKKVLFNNLFKVIADNELLYMNALNIHQQTFFSTNVAFEDGQVTDIDIERMIYFPGNKLITDVINETNLFPSLKACRESFPDFIMEIENTYRVFANNFNKIINNTHHNQKEFNLFIINDWNELNKSNNLLAGLYQDFVYRSKNLFTLIISNIEQLCTMHINHSKIKKYAK